MSERNNAELVRLKQNLAKDQHQQDYKGTQVESVRVQLEKIARESIAKYHREVETTRPEALIAINQVIQPWLIDLISSGTYAELLGWCRSHENGIRLSDTTMYYWPEDALKSVAKDGNRLYSDTARFVVEQYKGQNIQRGIQVHADGDEVWYSGFELESSKWEKSEGVRIWREPMVGMGFGFAMISRSYGIPVDAQNVVASLDRISPEVWIKFGQQVETGDIWEIISRSMKPRKIRVSSPEETQRHREDARRRAGEYIRSRQWH